MEQTAVEYLVNRFRDTIGDSIINVMTDEINQAKKIEKQQQGYSEEDLKYAFDSGRVRLTFDKKRPFVFKNYEEFIEKLKNE